MNTDRPHRMPHLRSDPRLRPARRREYTPLQLRIKRDLGVPIPFPYPIPASVLRAAVEVYADFSGANELLDAYDREMCWAYVLYAFCIPPVWSWNGISMQDTATQRIPLKIVIQLVGQRIKSGISVEYAGRRMLVVDTFNRLGELGDIIEEIPDPKTIWLAEPSSIDLTC